jgi:hypothetical protein
MSHHYSGVNLGFPHGDARLNFTDLFAFPKPGDASKSILIMNAHPSASLQPPGPTTAIPFATDALYEVMIDTDGDAVADIAYSVRFSSADGGKQIATLRRISGSTRTGKDGLVIAEGAPVSIGSEPAVTDAGSYRFFAGWRSDPFFFDTLGAINNLTFTGSDYFADKNVCSIAIELPNSELGSEKVSLWARTLDGSSGTYVQADRGARASQEPFLIGDQQAAYLAGEPAQDARFIPVFAHSLQHTGGYTPDEATRLATTMLPDVLPYQPAHRATYPSNGRTLTDDAGGYFITEMSKGKFAGDGLRPHTDLLVDFPYEGPPHET